MCSSCKHLDINNKKDGVVSGALYYCTLRKEYVYADGICHDIINDANRDKEIINNIKEETKLYDDIPISPEILIFIIVILVLLGLMLDVF